MIKMFSIDKPNFKHSNLEEIYDKKNLLAVDICIIAPCLAG